MEVAAAVALEATVALQSVVKNYHVPHLVLHSFIQFALCHLDGSLMLVQMAIMLVVVMDIPEELVDIIAHTQQILNQNLHSLVLLILAAVLIPIKVVLQSQVEKVL